jgi:hypothetical protein
MGLVRPDPFPDMVNCFAAEVVKRMKFFGELMVGVRLQLAFIVGGRKWERREAGEGRHSIERGEGETLLLWRGEGVRGRVTERNILWGG